jgi:23S rRNA (adenine2503-C2)-methyltransferase
MSRAPDLATASTADLPGQSSGEAAVPARRRRHGPAQPVRPGPRLAGGLLRAGAGREALPRAPGDEVDLPPPRHRLREMTDLGKALRAKLEDKAEVGPRRSCSTSPRPTAPTSGCWAWIQRGRGGVHPRQGPRHPVRVLAGGLRAELPFCSTATQGFNRNLSAAEIIGQVWVAARHLGNVPHRERKLTNVVMMGMGEPLLNFDNVVRAMSIMRDDLGYRPGQQARDAVDRRPGADDRPPGEESDVSLAVSLHAPTDELRTELVPLNRKYPIAELMDACARYALRKRAQLDHVRVHPDEGRQRPARARPRTGASDAPVRQRAVQMKDAAKVNLIPFNPFPGTRLRASRRGRDPRVPEDTAQQCRDVLTPVRRTRGDDIDAACGQLKGQVPDRTRRQAEFRKGRARDRGQRSRPPFAAGSPRPADAGRATAARGPARPGQAPCRGGARDGSTLG